MARIYYSRQYYNQLKKKQYEEYLKRLNRYYLYRKKCYEEYVKRQNEYRLYKRKYYEEYIKRRNKYYLDEKKYYEEYLKRQNSYYSYRKKYYEEQHKRSNDIFVNKRKYGKTYTSQEENFNSFKTDSVEDNNINDDIIKKNSYDSLEINIEENNLEYKKHNSAKCDNLEKKNCSSSEEAYNEQLLNCGPLEIKIEENNLEYKKTDSAKYDNLKNKDCTNSEDVYNEELLSCGSLEINIEENNLECKKPDLAKYDNLEKKSCTSIEDLYNEEVLNCGPLGINIEENNLECKKPDSAKCDNLENKNCSSTEGLYNEEFLGKEDEDENQVDKCNIGICKTTVSPKKLPLRKPISHTSDVTKRLVTVKIPVVLTECSITLTIQSSIKLEDAILEIKHVRKNVYLNQCKLIPNSENGKPNTGILFLAGFIRSDIEYSTKESNDKEVLSGKVKHATVNVPFECTTRVTFNTPPKFKTNTSQDEVEILQTSIGVCNPYEEEIMGSDIREQSFRLIEYFNEKVFCELISAEFVESDILENPINKECKSPLEQTFHDITETVVLFLTIKLLQNQNVIISK